MSTELAHKLVLLHIYVQPILMTDFHAKREEFLKGISKLTADSNLPVPDIRLHQLPTPGITILGDADPQMVRKIMKIYNEVFNK